MSLRKVIDSFKLGRRFTDLNSDSLSIETTEEGFFYTGFRFVGQDAEYFRRFINRKTSIHETVPFYMGALSRPMNVAKFLYSCAKGRIV
jgi:hypothetical protein